MHAYIVHFIIFNIIIYHYRDNTDSRTVFTSMYVSLWRCVSYHMSTLYQLSSVYETRSAQKNHQSYLHPGDLYDQYNVAHWVMECIRETNQDQQRCGRMAQPPEHKPRSGNKGQYTLAPLLHEESDCLPLNAQFISEGKLKKIQKKPNRTMEMYILDNWERYINAEKSVSRVVGHGLEESDKPRTVPTMHHVVPILEPNRRSIECRD